jgi:hypothetical protein
MKVDVIEIDATAKFIDFAYFLNKDNKFWVAELKKNALELLKLSHPFWRNAERKLFIAYKDGSPAGRIAAIINRTHNEYHNERCGFFGFFETVDDKQVSAKLFESAENWLKFGGMEIIRGPVNPSTNYSCGMLISSFDSYPKVMMPYNPPYYNGHMQSLRYKKAKDLYAFARFTETPISERIEKIVSRVEKNIAPVLRNIKISDLKKEMETIRKMAHTAKNIKPILNPKVTYIMEVDGKPAAFSVTIPDVNVALKKIKGRITPFNFVPFLWNLRKIKQGRLILLGTVEEFRNKGLELLMIKQVISDTRKLGWHHGEISWILQDNERIVSIIKEFGGKLYKKYRIYEKSFTLGKNA